MESQRVGHDWATKHSTAAKGAERLTVTVATRREEYWCGFHNGNEVFTTAVFKCSSSKILRDKNLYQECLLHEQAYAYGWFYGFFKKLC